jgi:FAD/FMN-containing dehydrogenase/Fe-S oxidoreductase
MFRQADTPLEDLRKQLEGEFFYDEKMRRLYATDASMYRELPLAVAYPKHSADLQVLIRFAKQYKTSLIPRTAGTSLAGQVVGSGIVIDLSKHFCHILEVSPEQQWVKVQPGVIRNDLNKFLQPYGLFFGPETATQSRAMIGGMVGNNSCGSNSMIYGSTREHVLGIKALLSDGSEAHFSALSPEEYKEKLTSRSLEGTIYRKIHQSLFPEGARARIRKHYPKSSIPRRNTGYALDLLLDMQPFEAEGLPFDLCKLLTGSEGTLALITEITLRLLPLPPPHKRLVCIHCQSIDEALRANLLAVQASPNASELIDHYILECTKSNTEQQKNRFFVQGDPQAILAVELNAASAEEADQKAAALVAALEAEGLGHHYPILQGEDIPKVWALRNAGLGLLANIPGDAKAVCVVEDTAVDVQQLPEYIAEFNKMLAKYGLYSVHYAHAGSGELHLRPIINLKTAEGHRLFRKVAEETALLVKKYQGSLSGEHGDGRLRAEFIPLMIGQENYELLRSIKYTFDPDNIFNPNKIVDAPPMDSHLRYEAGQPEIAIATTLNFEKDLGILRLAEKCNGAGECRRSHLSGGTMCPSYMATRNEQDTTRARANILREYLTHSHKSNRFDHEEIKEVMDLCLSCKGCKSECPSNVDVAKLKAEFLQQYYDAQGVPFRTRLVANFTRSQRWAALLPSFYNYLIKQDFTSRIIKKIAGFAPKRSLPGLYRTTLRAWFRRYQQMPRERKVLLFCDEFTNYNDTEVGIKTILLLNALGYEVRLAAHQESARTYLSKGLLRQARKIAYQNIQALAPLVSQEMPLIGIEPSAILSFRDEYIDLMRGNMQTKAEKLAQHCFLLEEFLAAEIEAGHLRKEQFDNPEKRIIKVHGHCHQKALSSMTYTKKVLSFVPNCEMHLIPSGCCGMAGSFGYEQEHYEVSMQIGELVLFPALRSLPQDAWVVASGTSCRHQIKDGTDRKAMHLAEALWEMVKKD